MSRLIELKRSTFYHFAGKVDNQTDIAQQIETIYHEKRGNYVYRRIILALKKVITINHKKVHVIMQRLVLKGKSKQRKYCSYQGDVGKIAENLLQRDFQATKPNEKGTTDVAEFKCAQGKLYLSPIKDLFNGKIIAYDVPILSKLRI